jgi:dihydroorotate dehydrogenase electron transfer subunit
MFHVTATVLSHSRIADRIHLLEFLSPQIAESASPGQFLNVRVRDSIDPLLRRPYSISQIKGDMVGILFEVVGKGTTVLSKKQTGDSVDLIGPLGIGFRIDDSFDTAVLVAGGIGVAPFPFLNRELGKKGKSVISFVGARGAQQVVTSGLENVSISTDDGSVGFRGNVVDCLREYVLTRPMVRPKIFGCGPNVMLKSLSLFANSVGLECEVSLESEMACGVGLCQGCPIKSASSQEKYYLVCKDGPVFNAANVIL